MPANRPAITALVASLTLAACVADVPVEDDVADTEPAGLTNAPVAATVSGAASGERLVAPSGPVTATVFHPRLALMRQQAVAGLPPCAYTQDVVLYTASGKAYPALVDADFRGTGLALVALDRPSSFIGMTVASTASLVGSTLTCYGSHSRTQVATTPTHVTLARSLREAKHEPWPPGTPVRFEPADSGMACFDSRGMLVATHAYTSLPNSASFIVFDPDDATYAVARALAKCGYAF